MSKRTNLRKKLFLGGMSTLLAGYIGFMGGISLADQPNYERYLHNKNREVNSTMNEELRNEKMLYELGGNIAMVSLAIGLPGGLIGWISGLKMLADDKEKGLSGKLK